MRIYSMTATFGKLEHETLTLRPGLNVIEAPNEWGKSTWCAFLVAMLYGVETRTHSTKTALADKERYAPWSGAPMSGRIDLDWNGRDITIERRTKGRLVFGVFSAYETASGTAVPELTAANCGLMLLGVEKSVFLRAGFLRLTDLPVSQDDALQRRLNALVTTGDESGAGEALAQKLKELKNRCRFNRSGLLPQAEQQRGELTHKLRELRALQEQSQEYTRQKADLERQLRELENHSAALQYTAAQADARRVAEAAAEKNRWESAFLEAGARCEALPTREQAQAAVEELLALKQQMAALQEEAPSFPAGEGHGRKYLPWLLAALVCLTAAGAVFLLTEPIFALIPLCAFLVCGGMALYGYREDRKTQNSREAAFLALQQRKTLLQQRLEGENTLAYWQGVLDAHGDLEETRKEHQRAVSLLALAQAMAKTAQAPAFPDRLTYSEEETQRRLADCRYNQRQLELRLGQCIGQMAQLGDRQALEEQLDAVNDRIRKLEDTYAALSIAQQTLAAATAELQRRFAPRISRRTQELFAALTGDRYDRVTLDQDLSLQAGARQEDTLRPSLWRSDGTADQLYIALRLAVAEALTPEAPLILDDALARFDDVRLKAALAVLCEEAESRQVLLFTCHSREKNMM